MIWFVTAGPNGDHGARKFGGLVTARTRIYVGIVMRNAKDRRKIMETEARFRKDPSENKPPAIHG